MNEDKMMIMGMNPTMLKSLGITPDGKCAKHPHIPLLCEPASPSASHPPPLQECECCWKEQQERKNQSCTDLTMTTSVSISPSEIGGVVPPPLVLQNATSATTLPSGTSKSSEAAKQYAEWSDTVMMRWNQVQEIGIGGSGSGGTLMLEESQSSHTAMSLPLSALNGESFHGNQTQNHVFNMSMAAVAEEPDERTNAMSQPSPSFHPAMADTAQSPPWRRLEEQVQRQEEAIQKLQETVQHQETSIRHDLQHLIQLVSNLAANQPSQYQQQQQHHAMSSSLNHHRDISVGVLETPILSNKQLTELPSEEQQPLPPSTDTTPSRPSLYRKSDHHPANIFTSVRTIERKPPKPPMRHNSFSTRDSRRQSVGSASHLASIISSLGNSTLNDATTYNDTTTTATPARSSSDNITPSASKDEDLPDAASPAAAGYGPGVESMLERARSKPLEIIFDASGRIDSGFLHAKEEEDAGEANNDDDDVDEKKSESSTGSPNGAAARRVSPPQLRQSTSSSSELSKRESFLKSPGSIRLTIPDDGFAESEDEHDMAVNRLAMPKPPNLRSRTPSPLTKPSAPARITRKATPPFQSNAGQGSNRPVRQPRRELSVTDVTTEKAANRRSRTFPSSRPDIYVPPAPPPGSYGGDEPSNTQQLGRLHPSNLSKLGASTAPPRREIFATGNSKLQISCLTIDTALLTNENDLNTASTHAATKYREVSNMAVTDKFGDKGIYTGTLREEEMEAESTTLGDGDAPAAAEPPQKRMVGIPHGTGTMKYESGRFYKGEWREGHWHGRGILRNENGDSYEGDFVLDARHGHGIYKYENGDVYEGDFTEDKRHGKGTFMFQNGSVYRGDFVNGSFSGYGWYEFSDGFYEGQWKEGAYNGIGTLQYTDGGSYTGRFKGGVADGMGEEKQADGTSLRGMWKNGEFVGQA